MTNQPVFPGGIDPATVHGADHADKLLAGTGGAFPRVSHGLGTPHTEQPRPPSQGKLWDGDTYLGDPDPCHVCDGTGIDPEDEDYCVNCDGTGDEPAQSPWESAIAATPLADPVSCGMCRGSKKDPHDVSKDCPRCKGSGLAPDQPSPATGAVWNPVQAECTRCAGKKHDPVTGGACVNCQGKGTVTRWQAVGGTQEPAKPAWQTWPWDDQRSRAAANSTNVFIKTYGMYRDVNAGYFSCKIARHWGPKGGAGMVPFIILDGQPLVLLSHRSRWVENGDTWSSFGGAIDAKDATPLAAAVRETFEEIQGLPKKGQVIHKIESKCSGCGWTYTTFLVQVEYTNVKWLLEDVRVSRGHSSWETEGIAWVPAWMVKYYKLHPGFAKSWNELRQAITKRVTQVAQQQASKPPASKGAAQ